MRKWSKRSLDNLQGIHPDLRRVMDRALQESPLDFTVIEGLRTVARQKELVAKGASKTMNSRHITGHAVDLMPTAPNGKGSFDWSLYHRLAPAVKAAAKAEGVALVWGGDWKTFPDGPHFELDRKVYPAGVGNSAKPAPKPAQPAPELAKKPNDHKPITPGMTRNPNQPKHWLTHVLAFFAAISDLFTRK
jgi:peptidoglycan LD-endopeptidase CwlK